MKCLLKSKIPLLALALLFDLLASAVIAVTVFLSAFIFTLLVVAVVAYLFKLLIMC